MMGFTLSKLNLLILVTAMFAIIAFFMFSLSDIVVSNLAQQLVKEQSETVFGLVSGEILCRKSDVTIPESIQYFGGMMPSKRFYYVMHVKRYPEVPQEGSLNTLIFQVASRKEPDMIIATSSIDLNASIFLYDWNPETDIMEEKSSMTIDPESMVTVKNSMVLVKEVYQGKNYLHIIACSSDSGLCERNLGRAACWVSTCSDNPRESTCFPLAENCATKISC